MLLEASGLLKSSEERMVELYLKEEERNEAWREERTRYLREEKLGEGGAVGGDGSGEGAV